MNGNALSHLSVFKLNWANASDLPIDNLVNNFRFPNHSKLNTKGVIANAPRIYTKKRHTFSQRCITKIFGVIGHSKSTAHDYHWRT